MGPQTIENASFLKFHLFTFLFFITAVREGKAVLQKMAGKDPILSVDRILKRCELLVTCVRDIQPLLEEVDNPAPQTSLLQEAEASIQPQIKTKIEVNTTSSVKSRSKFCETLKYTSKPLFDICNCEPLFRPQDTTPSPWSPF